MSENRGKRVETLPMLPLRGMIVYPHMMEKLDIGREKSLAAVERASQNDGRLFVVAQKDAVADNPRIDDVYGVGTVVVIKQAIRMPDDTVRLLVEGESRALLLDVIEADTLQLAQVQCFAQNPKGEAALSAQAGVRALKNLFGEYARERQTLSPEIVNAVESEENPGLLCDIVAASALSSLKERQQILETRSVKARILALTGLLSKEIQLVQMEKRILNKVQGNLERRQKEYYLSEQLAAIHEELGDEEEAEKSELEKRLAASKISGDAREKVEKEIKRYGRLPANFPEASVSLNYIETMLDLPWGVTTKDNMSVSNARRVLDEDHFGLTKVKERIVEFLAVGALKGNMRGPILCLIGPPGVGKTSIARSVARALDRKFVRLSLGGLRDEAEIRGHRRTYIGAMPGRIVSSISTCGAMNPVFLLDEIDKMASDYRGDPASALLEALDPEQNATFSDHYVESPFDLSGVLFITTANSLEGIPRPLLDRMEMIEISGYTQEEKAEIALGHLWPKELQAHGLTKSVVRLSRKAVLEIIDGYTRESGVRSLERELAALCRKAALSLSETGKKALSITPATVAAYLGPRRYLPEEARKDPETGVVNGLAWTPYGGETLSIEVAVMPGKGEIDLTGQLGDVMKESARAAYSYIRSRSGDLGIPADFHEKHDLHIHVPEGATPKDGPSAGVAMTCAMVSAITGRKARQDVAMTGEITLLGRVLPIGGVKEKLLAAHRMGIDTVLLPGGNRKDLDELPSDVRGKMHVSLIGEVDQALSYVLTKPS